MPTWAVIISFVVGYGMIGATIAKIAWNINQKSSKPSNSSDDGWVVALAMLWPLALLWFPCDVAANLISAHKKTDDVIRG